LYSRRAVRSAMTLLTLSSGVLGIASTRVCAGNGLIHRVDLPITPTVQGCAMKVIPMTHGNVELYPTGGVIGRAM
jgi:hypothetical protein